MSERKEGRAYLHNDVAGWVDYMASDAPGNEKRTQMKPMSRWWANNLGRSLNGNRVNTRTVDVERNIQLQVAVKEK